MSEFSHTTKLCSVSVHMLLKGLESLLLLNNTVISSRIISKCVRITILSSRCSAVSGTCTEHFEG